MLEQALPAETAVAEAPRKDNDNNWLTEIKGLLGGNKLSARVKEAEELQLLEESVMRKEMEEDTVPEEQIEAKVYRVAAEKGINVSAKPRSTATTTGALRLGDVITITATKGGWLRIASWEAVTGWVKEAGDQALVAAPDVPLGLVHVRGRAARTEVLSWCQVSGLTLMERLPGLDLGDVRADSVHNRRWGLEARAEREFSSDLSRPPGRDWRVYAASDFKEGDVVEVCELIMAKDHGNFHPNSVLRGRSLCPFRGSQHAAVPLGFGTLYRRTAPTEANLEPLLEVTKGMLSGASGQPRLLLKARRAIRLGEELTTAGDFLGTQGGLGWETGSQPSSRDHPLPGPCGANTSSGSSLHILSSEVHGRGVFSGRSYSRGDPIELCPALVLDNLSITPLSDYAMVFDKRLTIPAAGTGQTLRPLAGQGNWDPLADPAEDVSAEDHEDSQLAPLVLTEVAQDSFDAEWDPFAQPSAGDLKRQTQKISPGEGKPSLTQVVAEVEWHDPFEDPAGVDIDKGRPRPRPRLAASPEPRNTPEPMPGPGPTQGYSRMGENEVCVLPLGCGALYNHKARQKGRNVRWAFDGTRSVVVMIATKDIQPNEELFISYGPEYWSDRAQADGVCSRYQC